MSKRKTLFFLSSSVVCPELSEAGPTVAAGEGRVRRLPNLSSMGSMVTTASGNYGRPITRCYPKPYQSAILQCWQYLNITWECLAIQYQTLGFPSFILPSFFTLRLPPLDSETGWTGELWSNPVLLILENFFFLKKSDFFFIYFEIFSDFQIF